MKRLFIYLILILCYLPGYCQGPSTVQLHEESLYFKELSFFKEGPAVLPVKEVRRRQSLGAFHPLYSQSINLGRVNERYWFSFTISSDQDNEVYLELSNPFLYRIELYDSDTSSSGPVITTGIDYPFQQRPIRNRRFVLPLHLHKGDNTFLMMSDRRQELLRFTFQLYTQETFTSHQNHDYLFFGSVFGMLALISLFSFTLLLLLRDKIYLYYLAYISLMFLFIVTDNGFGYEWIWKNLPWVQKYIRNFISLAAFGVHLQFFPLMLGITRKNNVFYPWIMKISHTCSLLLVVFGAGVILEVNKVLIPGWLTRMVQFVFYASFISGLVLLVTSAFKKATRGSKTAKMYLAATTPLVVQIAIVILSRWHVVDADIDTAKYLAVAIVLEIVILGLGLILRYYHLRNEKENLARELTIQRHANLTTMLGTQEAERKRIAEDLHDHLGGTLSALKGMLSGLPSKDPDTNKKLLYAQDLLNEACYDIRSIAHNLMPANFENSTLTEALEESVRKFNRDSTAHYQFLTHGDAKPLEKETELHIFRIASELLHNIAKHANATEVTLQLLYYPDMVELMIEDNGTVLFHPQEVSNANGIGLKNLYSRADCINAKLRYDSTPGGTTVICTIPTT